MTIELHDEKRKKALASIKAYFEERFEEEIGDLQAQLLLDYFLEELAPVVYNKAIADAQAFMQKQVVDIDATCYETEFAYWQKDGKKSPR